MSLSKKDAANLEAYADARRKAHGEVVREKIQTTKLIDELQKFALGNSRAKFTPARLKAIEMLLDKSVPDLAAIKHEVESQSVVFLIDTEFRKEENEQA